MSMTTTDTCLPENLDTVTIWQSLDAAERLENYILAKKPPPPYLFTLLAQGQGPDIRRRALKLARHYNRKLILSSMQTPKSDSPALYPLARLSVPFLEQIDYELQRQCWAIARHFNCAYHEALQRIEQEVYQSPAITDPRAMHVNLRRLIRRKWDLKLPEIQILPAHHAQVFSRHWYRTHKQYFLISQTHLPGALWAIQQGIHDAAKIMVLSFHPNWRQGLGAELRSVCEAFGMYCEILAFQSVQHMASDMGMNTGLSNKELEMALRYRMIEHCLRVKFDYAVHVESILPTDWVQHMSHTYKIPLSGSHLLRFVERFWGYPGLASAAMVGVQELSTHADVLRVLKGKTRLQYLTVLESE